MQPKKLCLEEQAIDHLFVMQDKKIIDALEVIFWNSSCEWNISREHKNHCAVRQTITVKKVKFENRLLKVNASSADFKNFDFNQNIQHQQLCHHRSHYL